MIQQKSLKPRRLRREAAELAAPLPPLLADAERLAATVLLGEHGRRRSGTGDEFWQYRPAHAGDETRLIDWRRSAKSDTHFIRQKEWQAAQSVVIWADGSASMQYASTKGLVQKSARARVLTLALATLLNRAGERFGLAGGDVPPRSGEAQLLRLAEVLSRPGGETDYGIPTLAGLRPDQRAVFISDFMGDTAGLHTAMAKAADRRITGAILQVLDPAEEAFPFTGRTIFESVGGTLNHETLKANDLKSRYLDRLAARKAELAELARQAGWEYSLHHTDQSAAQALLWLYQALERRH